MFTPLVCLGDFNKILSPIDKVGDSYQNWRGMLEFGECMVIVFYAISYFQENVRREIINKVVWITLGSNLSERWQSRLGEVVA